MPYGLWTQVNPGNHVLDEMCKNGWTDRNAVWTIWTRLGPRKHALGGGAYWRNLMNTIEQSMRGGDAAFLSNYFDHFLLLLLLLSFPNYTAFTICWHLIRITFPKTIEMWANAQRDGRPAECRWYPLFNAAKFSWRPLLECRAVTLPRRETRWNLQGCPKLANRSLLLVGRSLPYCEHMCGRHCCLTIFPIVDVCLSCEDTVRQSCAMVSKMTNFWPFFWLLHFQWAACSTFQTCILNSH